MKKILLTNDDGIWSEGLKKLAICAKKFGEVWIVAPEKQRSGCSHSETLHEKIILERICYPVEGVYAYSCTGTPADCVKAGIRVLLGEEPDAVLTGINEGFNCGYDLQYSGTVGAAMEGSGEKSISIAFSEGRNSCHEVTDLYLEDVLKRLIERHPGKNRIWNVNFPECRREEFRGILENRSVSRTSVLIDRFKAEGTGDHMEITVEGIPGKLPEEGSDYKAVRDNYISIGCVTNLC